MKFYPSVASKRPTLLSLILFNIALIIVIAKVEEIKCQIYYQIPNPFNEQSLESKDYYMVKSYQTTVSSHKKKTQLLVEEYSSLSTGLTFSIHKNQDDLSQSYLLINDGPNSRYYIVRDPKINTEHDQNEDENGRQINLAVDCELDHLHHHRRIFPWQFVYDIKDTSNTEDTEEGSLKKYKRRNKKKGWSTKRSVYGVIGIWLNAIERKIVSKDVGELSPYSGTNVWVMRDNDIEAQILFEKPNETAEAGDPMQKLLNSTMIDSIHLDRTPLIESDPDVGGVVVPIHSFDIIQVKNFQSNVDSSSPFLKQFLYQLARCRKENRASRLFPSLIRAVNMSPERMYAIHYLEHKFGALSVGKGGFDDIKHRHVRNVELHAEWFSFPLETQVFIYEGVPEYPDPEDKVHVFLRKFTELAKQSKAHDATVNYHIVEGEIGIENCIVGEFDPTFHWFKLLNRPVHFYQPSGAKLTGLHSGLGALLINAADNNHKQFNLFKKKISVAYDATNLKARRELRVDEWKLIDEKSGRIVQFYFKQSESERDDHRITDLVRIDIRDINPDDQASAVEDAALDDLNDYDLIARYDILKLDLLKSESEINFIFSKPQICPEQKTDFSSASHEEEKDWQTETDENETDYHHVSIDSDSDEAEDTADNEKDQNDGEDFEFEPGTYAVSSAFPDLFNYIEGHDSTYGFLSTITLADPNEEVKSTNKKIYMKETVNLGANLARVSVFYSQSSFENSIPDLDYYINYNSEVMLEYTSPHCSIVDEFQPWLRLFSSRVTYYKTNAIHTSIVEGDVIRMYGVSALWRQAIDSPSTYFLGAKRKLVNDTEGNSYKELIWTQMEDNDSNMELRFKFLLNVTSKANKLDHDFQNNPLQLHSIYINRLFDDDEYNGKFKKFIISEPKMFLESDVTLPGSCMGILRNHKSSDYVSSKVELPSLDEFFYSSDGYTAHYIVTQAADRDTPNEKLTSYQVTESYDRHLDYRKFTVGNGPETREVIINSEKNTLYLFAMGICKHVRNLHGLVDVQSEFLTDDTDYETGKLYGLAQLFSQIAKKKDFVLEAEVRHDVTGNKYERRVYRNKGELITSGAKKVVYNIELIFIVRPNVKTDDEHYELVSIEFSPFFFSSERRSQVQNMHRTTIEILNINKNGFENGWYLPDECEKLNQPSASSSDSLSKFPILSDLLGQSGFYIRSEISSSSQIQGETEKIFILDEWKLARDLRLKSFGLKKNFDLIIYGLTKESFDLSTNYRCSNELPMLRTEYRNNGKKSLLDLFSKNITFVESLSELYYSTIALWHLAENNPATVSLSNTVELAPLAKSGTLLDQIEREMKSETWLVQNPMAKWSYEMTFELHSKMFDKTLKTWRVLSKIKVTDYLKSSLVEGEKKTVDIDIVNYRYKNSSEIKQKNLRLPEGFGCVRSREVLEEYKTINDDLLLDRNKPYYIWYEASLEKVKKSYNDPNLGSITLSRGVLPTVIGTFMKSADWIKVAPYLDLRVHYSSMRLLNGTRTTTKVVMDKTNDLIFTIDRKSGQCQIGRRENKDWTIEFADEVGVQKLRIDEYMFLTLFAPNTTTFNPLNRYTDEFGRSINEYEDSLYFMKLTDKLEGPISIIRRFERSEDERLPFLIRDLNVVKFHSSVLVKVMLFNLAKTDLEAVLYFNIRHVTPIHLSELIEHMDVESCYTDDIRKPTNLPRTFAVEYECQQPNRDNFDSELFKDKFLTQLIMNSQFLPSQLSGPLIMDHDDNSLIRISFNVLDPPTSVEFNTRFLARSRMTPDMELKAEVKLVASIWDCSVWCDQVGCVAMSYCSDHTCRVITPNILINGTISRYLNKKEVLPLINSVVDSDCSYLYRIEKRPRTVQSFADFMDVSLNSGKNLTELRLETDEFCSTINPTRFYEIKDQFDLIKEDLDGLNQNENTYVELRKDHKLDDTKLEELSVNFKSLTKQPISSYSDCMSACNMEGCSLFSYCREQRLCSIVVGSGDLKVLEPTLRQADEKLACSVSVLDFLDSYNRFDNTKQPLEFETKLEDYTSLECASICNNKNRSEQYTFDCMSFDICRNKENSKSTCYLHKEHVMSDSFDRRILEPKSFHEATLTLNANETISISSLNGSCQHYSKSILSDYLKLKNIRVTSEEVQSVKGYSAERCALDCQDDNKCYAFEYCFDDTKQPVQSCYFIRINEGNLSLENPECLKNYITKSSKPSVKCSIYVLKHFPEQYLVDGDSQNIFIRATSQLILEHNTLISTILKLLFYLFSSIIIGIAIQFSYRKLLGRSISVTCIG